MAKPMKKIFLSLILAGFYFFFPHSSIAAGPTLINSNTINSHKIWTKANSPYVIANDVSVSFDLIIESGAVIKFKNYGGLNILAGLTAIGTENEPIIFTSYKDDSFAGDTNGDGDATMPKAGDWDHINLYGGGTAAITIDHAKVFYGSPGNYVIGALSVNRNNNITIRNSEIKYNGYIGILVYQAQPTIENNIISNNERGIIVWNKPGEVAKATNNSIMDNSFSGAGIIGSVSGEGYMRLDARNNWWGDKTGPYYKHNLYGTDNLQGKGNKIGDGVIYDPWLGKDPNKKRNPVILIPGIGAAVNLDTMIGGIMNDNWTLFSHTYDGIIEAFKSMDYEEGKDFFIAYYDWRQKNEESARDYLLPLIKKAVSLNGTSKVNIIAHSMGGLVARSYIQSDDYANDVDNLFLIGAPNMGSSDVYPVWEGGRIPDNWDIRVIIKLYLSYLTFKNPTSNFYETIHQYIPSVKQLMPVYNYIYSKNSPADLKNYSEMQEVNSWLENLNDGIEKLNNRVKVSVISGDGHFTVNGIPVIDTDENPLWIDGKPDPTDPVRNDLNGDGRVLLSSAQIQSMFSDILVGNHGKIVSMAESIIAPRINEYLDIIYPAPDIPNELGFWFASPVDVEIKDPEGRILSKDENNIPLAKYASESKPDGFKIVSIPNPVDGKYKIKIVGNGEGEFHIGSEYFDYENGKNDRSSVVNGTIGKGEEKEYIVKYNSTDPQNPVTPIAPKDEISPTIAIFSPKDHEGYENNLSLSIHYSVADNVSKMEDIETAVYYDENEFSAEKINLYFEHLGEHSLKITAEDEAGNKAENEIKFTVVATIDSIIENVGTYEELGLVDSTEAKFLLVKLKVIKQLAGRISGKENAAENFREQTNRHIDWLIEYISEKSDKKSKGEIREPAKSLLIESLNFIKLK